MPFFVKLDTDGNRFLDVSELEESFGKMDTNGDDVLDGGEVDVSQCQVLVDAGDDLGDGDGQLSRAEFYDLLDAMDIDGEAGLYAGEMYAYLKHHSYLE